MQHIRPYKLFALLEAPPSRRICQLQLPPRRGAGGVTVLEMTALIAALQAVRAKSVFEIGTFLGSTTLNLALNIPADGKVLTLDLDKHALNSATQHPADAVLTEIHIESPTLDFQGSAVEQKITTLNGNSVTFDYNPFQGSIDFVFIDGGHDFDTVKSDTENARQLLSTAKESCIAWHDYRNAEYPELSGYLDDLSQELPIFHVEETRLCFYFNDPQHRIVPKLKEG